VVFGFMKLNHHGNNRKQIRNGLLFLFLIGKNC
jgi:hypothetical protein